MWAIKVKFEDDWLYVLDGNVKTTDFSGPIGPVLTFETEEAANEASQIWNPGAVKVVPYNEDSVDILV